MANDTRDLSAEEKVDCWVGKGSVRANGTLTFREILDADVEHRILVAMRILKSVDSSLADTNDSVACIVQGHAQAANAALKLAHGFAEDIGL